MRCLSVSEIFSILPAPCFDVIGFIVLFAVLMSLTLRLCSSTGLSAVSLLIHSLSDSVFPAPAISVLTCSSVGMFGIFSSLV